MSPRRWAVALAGAVVVVAASRCSVLLGNFTECGDGLAPCGAGRVCHLTSGSPVLLGPTTFITARNAVQGGGDVDVLGASGQLDFQLSAGEAPGAIELWQVDAGTIRPVTVIP